MKFTLKNLRQNIGVARRGASQSEEDGDILQPLRSISSPLSLNSIKHYIFEYSAGPLRGVAGTSIWTHLRSFGPDFFALGAIAVFLCNVSVPSAFIPGAIPASIAHADKVNSVDVPYSHIVTGSIYAQRMMSALPDLMETSANNLVPDHEIYPMLPVHECLPLETSHVFAPLVSHSVISQAFEYPLLPQIEEPAKPHLFASLQGGATFDPIRMLTEGISIGGVHDWQMIAIQYTAAAGQRDKHDLMEHHTDNDLVLQSADRREVSVLIGAVTAYDKFHGSLALGPSYLFSTSTYFNQISQITTEPVLAHGLGLLMQASIGYELGGFFSAGITGFANLQSGVAGAPAVSASGILLSITAQL